MGGGGGEGDLGSDLNPESKCGFHPVDADGTARSEFRAGLYSDCLEQRPF